MQRGPLQLLVIELDKRRLDGAITAGLALLVRQRQVRLIDVLGIHKDDQGVIWSIDNLAAAPTTSLAPAATGPAGSALLALMGLAAAAEYRAPTAPRRSPGLLPEDVLEITARISAGGDALLILLEHTWLVPLHDAVKDRGGVCIAGEFLSAELQCAISAELSVHDSHSASSGHGGESRRAP